MFTNQQKLEALERELRFRIRVYANRVMTGRMTKEKSDYELGIVRAMIDDYAKLAETERLL